MTGESPVHPCGPWRSFSGRTVPGQTQWPYAGRVRSTGNLLLSVMGAFAEFERALILERQREGIAKAKENGVYKGRKPALTDEQARELNDRAARGESKTSLAKAFGISRETVYSYLRAEVIPS
ncbi:MAG: Resolvase-like [Actinomycetia bacterium]|nr:Resolvase-like [Actinomycetes bacterium]